MLRSPPNVPCTSTPQPDMSTSMQATMQAVSTSGVDPFLGQGGNSLESHARQNSGDSGLGECTSSLCVCRWRHSMRCVLRLIQVCHLRIVAVVMDTSQCPLRGKSLVQLHTETWDSNLHTKRAASNIFCCQVMKTAPYVNMVQGCDECFDMSPFCSQSVSRNGRVTW